MGARDLGEGNFGLRDHDHSQSVGELCSTLGKVIGFGYYQKRNMRQNLMLAVKVNINGRMLLANYTPMWL